MPGFLRSLFGKPAAAPAEEREAAPARVALEGGAEFPLAEHTTLHHGYPILDWEKVWAWTETFEPEARQLEAWAACERAWLLQFRDALGARFRLDESDRAAVISSLEPHLAQATLGFMGKTLRRIGAVLDGIARAGSGTLIVFDDEESYYRYVSYYYPESGEFAFSGGMHIHKGYSHYVAVKSELRQVEATIAHEMTHSCLGHLPLPLWLNEGLAMNTEERLTGVKPSLLTPDRLHDKLRRFWSVVSIQEFWSGRSFDRPGDSNQLSYALARIIVEQLAKDWGPFREFVLRADRADAGAAAARECLGLDLGSVVTVLLERETPKSWSPDPAKWEGKE
jgi:hypothetical protein